MAMFYENGFQLIHFILRRQLLAYATVYKDEIASPMSVSY